MTEKTPPPSPIRETDEEARQIVRDLLGTFQHAVLAVNDAETGFPMTSRIALVQGPDATPVSLISDLSHHTEALKRDGRCSVLIGEPGPKGDPLTHPRLTLQARARFLRKGEAGHDDLRAHYLSHYPKAKLYVDFMDFSFVMFDAEVGHLNGGFGKAYCMTPQEMGLPERN